MRAIKVANGTSEKEEIKIWENFPFPALLFLITLFYCVCGMPKIFSVAKYHAIIDRYEF